MSTQIAHFPDLCRCASFERWASAFDHCPCLCDSCEHKRYMARNLTASEETTR